MTSQELLLLSDVLLGDVVEHIDTRLRACVVDIRRAQDGDVTQYYVQPACDHPDCDCDLGRQWWRSHHARRVPCRDPYRRYLAMVAAEDDPERQQRRQQAPGTPGDVERRSWRIRAKSFGPYLPEALWEKAYSRLCRLRRIDPVGAWSGYDLGREHWRIAANDCLDRRDRAARWSHASHPARGAPSASLIQPAGTAERPSPTEAARGDARRLEDGLELRCCGQPAKLAGNLALRGAGSPVTRLAYECVRCFRRLQVVDDWGIPNADQLATYDETP
jgi:hypothetical protein